MRPKLLLATNNQDKVREYISLLRNIPFELVTLAEQGINEEVDESGGSLALPSHSLCSITALDILRGFPNIEGGGLRILEESKSDLNEAH